jgi:4'-phosphopantetheinyl transferase
VTNSFELCHDLVRVWRLAVDALPWQQCENVLSPDEGGRARRYQFEKDRRQFVVTRAVLRVLLGNYLKTTPERVVFNYGEYGKPSLAEPGSGIRFNVSHSGELALIAVANGREVGVDVEFLRPMADREQLAAASFSSRELAEFRALPPARQQAAFFAGWTRKEAYLKARGGGLSIPLDSFAVSLAPHGPASLLEVRNDPLEPSRWGMADLLVAQGYAGALVAEGADWRVDLVDWNG